MFQVDLSTLVNTVVGGILAYAVLVVVLRVSGKRTLAKWNAFDLVVTVALGSTFATVLVSGQTSLAQGVVGFAVLVGLQRAVAWVAVRWPPFRRWIKSDARLLLHDGTIDAQALRDERVTENEVRAAIRARGYGRVEDVAAVVLETDGSVSVIGRDNAGASALVGVRGVKDNTGQADKPR
jgi:uncharacterized membrane protein YcaP (DUF421 family)